MSVVDPTRESEIFEYDKLQTATINEGVVDIDELKQNIALLFANMALITDKIIEHGSNEKGIWIKYESGMLFQTGYSEQLSPTGYPTAWGSSFHTPYHSWEYPIPFVGEIPITLVNGMSMVGGQGYQACRGGAETLTTSPEYYIVRPNAYTGSTLIKYNWSSMGRWML